MAKVVSAKIEKTTEENYGYLIAQTLDGYGIGRMSMYHVRHEN